MSSAVANLKIWLDLMVWLPRCQIRRGISLQQLHAGDKNVLEKQPLTQNCCFVSGWNKNESKHNSSLQEMSEWFQRSASQLLTKCWVEKTTQSQSRSQLSLYVPARLQRTHFLLRAFNNFTRTFCRKFCRQPTMRGRVCCLTTGSTFLLTKLVVRRSLK